MSEIEKQLQDLAQKLDVSFEENKDGAKEGELGSFLDMVSAAHDSSHGNHHDSSK